MTNEKGFSCPECFGTGFRGGFQAPCSRGCADSTRPIPDKRISRAVVGAVVEAEVGEEEDLSEQTGPWSAACLDPDTGRVPLDAHDDDERKALTALANFLELDGCQTEEASFLGDGSYGHGYMIEADGAEYSVMTDDEADSAWEDALDSYLDECILPELDGSLAQYFDRDSWKADARHDGRGHCLNPYDGNESDGEAPESLEDGAKSETFYIFRTN